MSTKLKVAGWSLGGAALGTGLGYLLSLKDLKKAKKFKSKYESHLKEQKQSLAKLKALKRKGGWTSVKATQVKELKRRIKNLQDHGVLTEEERKKLNSLMTQRAGVNAANAVGSAAAKNKSSLIGLTLNATSSMATGNINRKIEAIEYKAAERAKKIILELKIKIAELERGDLNSKDVEKYDKLKSRIKKIKGYKESHLGSKWNAKSNMIAGGTLGLMGGFGAGLLN